MESEMGPSGAHTGPTRLTLRILIMAAAVWLLVSELLG